MTLARLVPVVLAGLVLAGCDMVGGALGIQSPEKVALAREAEGKAIGGACRDAGRGVEDCFGQNRKADKAAVFAGWREMNDYMRENKMAGSGGPGPTPGAAADGDAASADPADKAPKGAGRGPARGDAKGDAKGEAKGEARADAGSERGRPAAGAKGRPAETSADS